MTREIDIAEQKIVGDYGMDVLELLLIDQSMTAYKGERHNIFWATSDYESRGSGYEFMSEIRPELIMGGEADHVIMPRVAKEKRTQAKRVKKMAEVFTPSWVCNLMCNVVDEKWFGRKDVFNVESEDHRVWESTTQKITYPEGKTWKDYVRRRVMEITCGEAPFLTSRYDTTTGEPIDIPRRIGLLDRKLRVINENVGESGAWLRAARVAYQNTMAYEWQGDSLLLARENLLYSFIENYEMMFHRSPARQSVRKIAEIISWNVWQMDGLKGVIPCTCHDVATTNLFGETVVTPCPGCKRRKIKEHNGVPCLMKHFPTGRTCKYRDILRSKE